MCYWLGVRDCSPAGVISYYWPIVLFFPLTHIIIWFLTCNFFFLNSQYSHWYLLYSPLSTVAKCNSVKASTGLCIAFLHTCVLLCVLVELIKTLLHTATGGLRVTLNFWILWMEQSLWKLLRDTRNEIPVWRYRRNIAYFLNPVKQTPETLHLFGWLNNWCPQNTFSRDVCHREETKKGTAHIETQSPTHTVWLTGDL